MFKTKSVHSKIEPREDGLRILAARGRGRGLSSDRYDIWMANLGPSEQLRDAILAGRISWQEYSRRYLEELRESDGIDRRNKQIKNHGQKIHFAAPPASGQDATRHATLPLRRR